ncbi:MAG: hypothetical protein ABI317_13490 [Gaiellales bacterium]
MTLHLRPTADLAERALLPEDPGAAMALAQALLHRPLMFNHSHGLWGYSGVAADGLPLTVQSTGIGGPSAAVVLAELHAVGLRRAIRVGTCAALDDRLALGELVIADSAIAADGAGRALAHETGSAVGETDLTPGSDLCIEADAVLTAGLAAAGPEVRRGRVASVDLFYRGGGEARWLGGDAGRSWQAQGALAVDLASAALFALGGRDRVAVGCILVAVELRDPPQRIGDDTRAASLERGARLALAALVGPPASG